jgi:Plasmid encoded RepA protein
VTGVIASSSFPSNAPGFGAFSGHRDAMSKSADRTIETLAETRFLLDEQDEHSADSVAYVHTVLSQIGLPRSPQRTREWVRMNGGASLHVLAGSIFNRSKSVWEHQPLPQGPYARLILADISSYAVKNKTRLIPMDVSAGAYMRNRLHLFVNGGKRGTYTAFKREAQALAAAHMELAVCYGNVQEQAKAAPIQSFRAWMVDDGSQQALWPSELVLDERFFQSLQAHAIPINMQAYRALAHSALAQDIYAWLVNRLPRLREPRKLYWAGENGLAAQFGGYADPKRFRKEFIHRLREVSVVYREARVEVVNGKRGEAGGYLLVKPSAPPVPRVHEVVPAALGAPLRLGPVTG